MDSYSFNFSLNIAFIATNFLYQSTSCEYNLPVSRLQKWLEKLQYILLQNDQNEKSDIFRG